MRTIVVGTGYTGRRLLRSLPPDAVTGLSRSRPADTDAWEIRELLLDGTPPALALPERYTLVYTVPPATDAERDYRLEGLLAALTPSPRRIVYLSTTGVYGNQDGRVVTEQTPVSPQTERARRRVAAETALAEFGQKTGSEITILRVPGIYGPDRVMIDAVRSGEPVLDEAFANPGNRIHVDDLVAACRAAMDPAVSPGLYNLGDGDLRSSTWVAQTTAALLGLPPLPTIDLETAKERFSPMRLSFLNESRIVDTTRMREVLGVTPRYANAEDGIRASLEAMGLL